MRLLLSGDVHIGRTSSRVPDALSRNERSSAAAWRRLVRLAIAERCDAVCLAGDVADQANKFWEAIGPLEEGVETLAAEGIRVVAVTGNHDHDVLVRLADQLPEGHLTLLGRGGRWQRTTIRDRDGAARLVVDGWSFATAHEPHDPLNSYDLSSDGTSDGDLPILGLVHGDLGVPDSPYAPLDRERLRRAAPNAWLLGHVHAPALHDLGAGGWALYPGSPQALDPGETGPHGPWLVDVDDGRIGTPEHRPTSTVRYERLDVDLSGAEAEGGIERRVRTAIRDAVAGIASEASGDLRWVSVRLRLVGTAPSADRIVASTAGLTDDFLIRVGDATVAVEAVTDDTVPPIDLAAHAATRGAAGVLARLLLELDADAPIGAPGAAPTDALAEPWGEAHGEHRTEAAEALDALLREARAASRDVDADRSYGALDDDDPDDATIRELLRRQARALLRELTAEAT